MKRETKAMLAGFDARRDEAGSDRLARVARPRLVSSLKPMGICAALEWAFSVEKVSLDLDNQPEWHVGTDTLWRLMRQHELGCRVDGGGRSAAHPDAEIIASFVAALPVARGGKPMAVQIAELARAGRQPDPMIDASLRCVPLSMAHGNRFGPRAKAEEVPADEPGQWGRVVSRGRPRAGSQWCRVTYTPTAQQVGVARRGWLSWWGALLYLAQDLRQCGRLEHVVITQDMPPVAPWEQRG